MIHHRTRQKRKIVTFSLLTLLFATIGFILIVWIKSPGESESILDKNGRVLAKSISLMVALPIGGVKQSIIIRGEDRHKPVMLVLHGGPGAPEFPFMKNIGLNLEKHFTVGYWEQRGAGKSFDSNIEPESMTVDQMISDAVEVSKYLQKRFAKRKIYVLGHSWGTFLGSLLVFRHPELYHGYVGVGQMVDQYQGEKLSFEWIKKVVAESNNKTDKTTIKKLNFPDSLADIHVWIDYLKSERALVNRYGGGFKRENYREFDNYKTIIFKTPEYTIRDKLNLTKGLKFSLKYLWDDIIGTDLLEQIDSIAIPVYIFQGTHDYVTPYQNARAFFDQLKAPKKKFFEFQYSAHTPFLDETEKFNKLIEEEILK